MPTQYVNVGGWLYDPSSAAYKQALKLYAQMPKQTTPAQAAESTLAQYTPKVSAPSGTPSYPVGSGGASPATGGTLAGAPGRFGQGAFGLVPRMPSPIATAGEAIGGNIGNLPAIGNLGTGFTDLSAKLAAMPYEANLPGYGGMLGESSQGIQSNLKGIIDPNEWEQLQTRMAERGTNVGISPSSPNFSTALMKALDQSIRERQTLGQEQLNRAIARTPTGQPFNLGAQQVSLGDMQNARLGASIFESMPDPTLAAKANLDMLLRAIEAGRAGGMGGVGGGLGGGGGGGGIRFVPLGGGGGGGGYPMSPYGGMGIGSPGWSGIVKQPFYRTPGSPVGTEQYPAPWSGLGSVDVNSGENTPLSPYEYDYTYQPEGMAGEDYGIYDPAWGDYFEQPW